MRTIAFVSLHPELIAAGLDVGPSKWAASKQLLCYKNLFLRDFAVDDHGSVDSAPYGGGDGMVLRPEPLADAVKAFAKRPYVLMPHAGGKVFGHNDAVRLSQLSRDLLFVCPRFGGVDQRFIDKYVDEAFSLGAFVISGGELAALTFWDAIVRQIPGVLGNAESAKYDSFAEGCLGNIEAPLYTRPPCFEGEGVPEVLTSGDHAAIDAWKKQFYSPTTK